MVERVNSSNTDLIVARHNIPIEELSSVANSEAGKPILPSVVEFKNIFLDNKNITWVMGDGSAFERLPRITCYEFKNHRFIVNGIGEVKDDVILILNEGKIYQYVIGNK